MEGNNTFEAWVTWTKKTWDQMSQFGFATVLWSWSRKEPKLLARARAAAGILKVWLRLLAPAPDQTKVVFNNFNSYIIEANNWIK
jgi:hypothetical protein